MKRIPPKIGFAVLETEDVEAMPPEARWKLLLAYGVVSSFTVGLMVGAVL